MRGEIPKASNKTFTIVRNPLDVLPSFASLVNTTTHGVKPDFSYDKDYPEWWDWYVRKFAKKNAHFFADTVRQTRETKTPLYIVRYEDLVNEPKETLLGLMAFCFEIKDARGTNLGRQIDKVLAKGSEATQFYKMKTVTGKFDANRGMYTEDQIKAVQEAFGEWMYYYGYADTEGNPTGFFYKGQDHLEEYMAKNYQFKKDNEAAIEMVTSEGYVRNIIMHNYGADRQ